MKADERSPRWDDCTCRHGERPLGRLHGIDMGRGIVRLGTTPNCPRHDACRGFTKEYRVARPWWSDPWCPKHPRKPCPDPA